MNELTYDAACAYLDTVMIPNSRTGLAIGRLVAEVDRARKAADTLADRARDLLVLLDADEAPRDEPLGRAIEQLDRSVFEWPVERAAPGGAGVDRADKTITK